MPTTIGSALRVGGSYETRPHNLRRTDRLRLTLCHSIRVAYRAGGVLMTKDIWPNPSDKEFAKYLLETLGPAFREAGNTLSADDVEDAGHRLLAAAEALEVFA